LELDPESAEGHRALGYYYFWGSGEVERALEEFMIAESRRPDDSEISASIGYVLWRLGRLEEAIAQFKKALKLDPRNRRLADRVAWIYSMLRQYAEAVRYNEIVISIAPDEAYGYADTAFLHILWTGSFERARAVLERNPKKDDGYAVTASWYLDYFSRDYKAALERVAASELEIIGPGHPRTLLAGLAYRAMNQLKHAQESFEAARETLERLVVEKPKAAMLHENLGLTYAHLGRKADAIRKIRDAMEVGSWPRWAGSSEDQHRYALAEVYTLFGEQEAAIDELEYILSMNSWISKWYLRLDPRWDPLRDHPRFQKLVGDES
jgi:serine/threonine-protein kinase